MLVYEKIFEEFQEAPFVLRHIMAIQLQDLSPRRSCATPTDALSVSCIVEQVFRSLLRPVQCRSCFCHGLGRGDPFRHLAQGLIGKMRDGVPTLPLRIVRKSAFLGPFFIIACSQRLSSAACCRAAKAWSLRRLVNSCFTIVS